MILGALVGLGPFTIDAYLPALPEIGRQFDASSSALQLTLSTTTLGFAVGQLVAGPLSDRFGRKLPLTLATALHILSSLAILGCDNVVELTVARAFQGIGAAGGAVIALAIARDVYDGPRLTRSLGALALFSGLAPIVAPIVGSQLLTVTSWKGVFVFLASLGFIIVLTAALLVPETHPKRRRETMITNSLRSRYSTLFRDRAYLAIVSVSALQFAAFFAYLSASSQLFQKNYGFDPQAFGLLFGINGVGLAIGAQLSSRLAGTMHPRQLLSRIQPILLAISMATVVTSVLRFPTVFVLISFFLFAFGYGFALPCVQFLALQRHPLIAGTAASILGASNFALGGLVAALVGLIGISGVAVGSTEFALFSLATAIFWAGYDRTLSRASKG
ncbi:MAG: Bcr/CflA family drug resistance efflux transporter [Glaciihabitans sp.]|nr:Bcr/CflA family drug resistance efflux transporter [Glaciihabitans sp.]